MKSIINEIKKANRIAILTHISEDADAIGSAAALYEALSMIGKKADIYLEDTPEERLEFVDFKYSLFDDTKEDYEYDLCICLDSGDLTRLGKRIKIFDEAERTVNIDHHYTNPLYADCNFVHGDSSSTGEILYSLIDEMDIEITKKIAEYLYISIASDSGGFKYSNTSDKTMIIAAKLLEKGIDHADICRRLFDTEKREVLNFKGYIMQNIEDYYDGKLCIVSATDDDFLKFNVKEKDLGDLVNIPRSVKGCEVAVAIRDTGDKTKISFRSNGKYDVSVIAAHFGGGGHKMASGATVNNDVNRCKSDIIDFLKGYLV